MSAIIITGDRDDPVVAPPAVETFAGRANYPTGQDIEGFLTGAALTLSASITDLLDTAAEAGRLDWERRVGYRPFLAGAASARRVDPPTRSRGLVLTTPLAALTSIVYQPTGSTAKTYVADTDFTLYPLEYADAGVPITRIVFATNRWLTPLSIGFRGALTITGQWGWATTVPEDAWMCIAALGGMQLLGMLSQAQTQGIVEWHEKDRGEKYSADPLETLQTEWTTRIDRAVSNYRRILF